MKKQMTIFKTGTRNLSFKLSMVFLLVISTFAKVQAQDSILPFNNPQLKYMGIAEGRLLFQVDFQQQSSENFTIEIKDQQGYQLYLEKFRTKNFRKQFAIEKADLENNTITFVVLLQGQVQKTFDVNKSLRMVEDISIVKQ